MPKLLGSKKGLPSARESSRMSCIQLIPFRDLSSALFAEGKSLGSKEEARRASQVTLSPF